MNETPSANVMDCAETRRWVQLRLDGEELPPELKGAFEGHLSSCTRCAAWAAKMETMIAKVARLHEPRSSFGFESRLMCALGLSTVPLWTKWAAGVALGVAGAWCVALLLVGENAVFHAREGLSLVPRALHFSKLISYLRPNLAGRLPDILSLGSILLGAMAILLVLGILASRMLTRVHTKPLTTRNA